MNLKYTPLSLAISLYISAQSIFAADVVCNSTLYFCGAQPGDNVTITTTAEGATSPLTGFGIYLNSSLYNLNDITITTSGQVADAIRSNGNNGGNLFSSGIIDIQANGKGADGINLGVRGGAYNSPSLNIVHLDGKGTIIADAVAVRANNAVSELSQSIIVLGNDFTLKQTGIANASNNTESIGYAVYAGNRTNDMSDIGRRNIIQGHRNNNKGSSYVFIGENADISSNSPNGAAVYANKSGIIQLGDNAIISAPKSSYYLFSATEMQNKGKNHTNETAEERPGTILLNGGIRFNNVDGINHTVMHSKGKGSIIKSGYMNYEVSENYFNLDPEIHKSSGVFLIGGNLLASEGGAIDLNMSNGSIFNGMTTRFDDLSNIYLAINGESSVWDFSQSSSLTELLLENNARLLINRNNGNSDLTLTGQVLNNSGIVDLFDKNFANNAYITTNFTIQGDYTGEKGILSIGTKLSDDKSQTDKLIIQGAATGSTELKVNNIGGDGAQTVNGIHVIQTGISSDTAFYIANGGYVAAGAYDYGLNLKKAGTETNTTTFDNWYLESHLRDIPIYTPDVGEYLAAETMGNTLFTSRLEDREGASQYQSLGNKTEGNVWIRAYGGHNQFKTMESQLKTTGNSFVTQIGSGLVTLGEEDQYNLGAMGGYAYYDGKTRSNLTDRESKTKIDGYSLGLYGTWYAHPVEKHGAYIDSWVLWNKFNNKIVTPDQNQYKYDSSGITASIEAGGDYLINKNGQKDWWIQPQVQLIYQGVHADDFKDAQGVDINHGKDNVQARIGVKTYLNVPTNRNMLTGYRPYVALNFIHNTNPYSVVIDDVRYENEGSANLGEFKVGVEGSITKNSQVWLNSSYVSGRHSNQAYQGNIGWKFNF